VRLVGGRGEQVQPPLCFCKIPSEFEARVFRLCYCNAADLLCWYVPPAPVVIAAPQWKCDNCGRNLSACPCSFRVICVRLMIEWIRAVDGTECTAVHEDGMADVQVNSSVGRFESSSHISIAVHAA
jgi:hypothetical protein